MNKDERYSFIESLIKHNSSGVLPVDKGGIEQETKLAKANDSDESILDEEQKGADFISPLLAVAVEKPRLTREREEDSLLTKSDLMHLSRELNRPVSFFKTKRDGDAEEKLSLAEKELNYTELSAFALSKSL
jgi:hypothetical protein